MKNHYEAIYLLAKNGSKEELQTYLATHQACIDEYEQGKLWFSPAAKLAKEGHFEAVILLQECGANTSAIAHGAALGGHYEYVEKLLTSHKARVGVIARGAAQGGYREYAEKLRISHKVDVGVIALGAVLGGYCDYAEELRILHNANVNSIAQGAAQGGHREYAEELRTVHKANVNLIAQGAAQGGHLAYLNHLKANMFTPMNKQLTNLHAKSVNTNVAPFTPFRSSSVTTTQRTSSRQETNVNNHVTQPPQNQLFQHSHVVTGQSNERLAQLQASNQKYMQTIQQLIKQNTALQDENARLQELNELKTKEIKVLESLISIKHYQQTLAASSPDNNDLALDFSTSIAPVSSTAAATPVIRTTAQMARNPNTNFFASSSTANSAKEEVEFVREDNSNSGLNILSTTAVKAEPEEDNAQDSRPQSKRAKLN